MPVEFFVPVKTVSEANVRTHHMVRAKRVAAQREVVTRYAQASGTWGEIELPCVVSFTRRSPGTLDDDNLRGAAKGCRDAIAKWLGVDDGSKLIGFKYDQEKCKKNAHGVNVRIYSKSVLFEEVRPI